MQLEWSGVLLLLIGNSLWDLHSRSICLWFTGLLTGEGLVLSLLSGRQPHSLLPAILPGLVLFGLSLLSSGAIGGGDGIVIGAMGVFLDLGSILWCCMFAFGFCALPAAFLFLTKRSGQASLPFLPFLLLGSIVTGFWIR